MKLNIFSKKSSSIFDSVDSSTIFIACAGIVAAIGLTYYVYSSPSDSTPNEYSPSKLTGKIKNNKKFKY